MPTEHVSYSYTFAELSEEAKEKAVATIAEKLSGDWWDQGNNDDISAVIVCGFAEAIGTPNVKDFGVSDFPGIDGVKLESWSCSYVQGDHVGFAGNLTRENAPTLPWVDGIGSVTLEARRAVGTAVSVDMDDAECICDGFSPTREPDCEAHTPNPATKEQALAMCDAVESALFAAHQAGYKEIEYIGSPEYAREWIESNETNFHEDGKLF